MEKQTHRNEIHPKPNLNPSPHSSREEDLAPSLPQKTGSTLHSITSSHSKQPEGYWPELPALDKLEESEVNVYLNNKNRIEKLDIEQKGETKKIPLAYDNDKVPSQKPEKKPLF